MTTPATPGDAVGEVDVEGLRRLLAAATPVGDWRAVEGDLEGGTLNDYIATLLTNRQNDGTTTGRLFMTLAPNDVDPERGAEVVPAMTGDGPRAEANAALIAAAVNALPALLDRLRVVEGERDAFAERLADTEEVHGTRVIDRADTTDRAEAAEGAYAVLVNLAMEHMNCSGCPTPWWLKQALGVTS